MTFDAVTFAYPGAARLALKKVTFAVAPGQTVAHCRRERGRQVHAEQADAAIL